MPQHARARQRGEGGFTLIELLVVMIIIAILMAVAVPTFLSQKQNAIRTQATSNVKQIVNAIESCGATNVDGTYNGCDWAKLQTLEPTLANITPPPAVDVTGTRFKVTVTTGTKATFSQENTDKGEVLKNCDPGPTPAGAKSCDVSKPAGQMW